MVEWIRSGEIEADDLAQHMNLSAFTEDQINTLRFAVAVGWSLVIAGKELITLVPYDEKPGQVRKRIHMSARKPVPSHRMLKQVRRWGNPERVAALDDITVRIVEADTPTKRMAAVEEWKNVEQIDSSVTAAIMLPEFETPKEKFVPPAAETQAAERVKKERHIVSERPALMHRGITSKGGQSYPSRTTLERRWSDGVIEYICAIDGCDSEPSTNRLSFRGQHYAMHVRKGEAPPLDGSEKSDLVDDPSYTEPAYTKQPGNRRLVALTTLLKGIDLEVISVEDLAEQIEQFLQTLHGGSGGGNNEPLTSEQVIERIRILVDTGKYADQEKTIQEQAENLETLMSYAETREAELEQRALEAEQKHIAAEAHLSALRDLINERITG